MGNYVVKIVMGYQSNKTVRFCGGEKGNKLMSAFDQSLIFTSYEAAIAHTEYLETTPVVQGLRRENESSVTITILTESRDPKTMHRKWIDASIKGSIDKMSEL